MLEVGGGYNGKVESCGQQIALDDDLQDHGILNTLILGKSNHITFIHLNKSNPLNMPAPPLYRPPALQSWVVAGDDN